VTDDDEARRVYRQMDNATLLAMARAFEVDMKGVSGKPSVHFAAHRLVLIAETLADRGSVPELPTGEVPP